MDINICGLQKMTLLDYPGKVACTVFLGGCNFRCPYCHNSELIHAGPEPVMTGEELLAFLKKRQGIVDAVCVSGGEPTLQPNLEELIRAIKALGFLVKLDTNGSRPQVLRHLAEEGLLDYVAMDVKSSPAGYARAVGLPALDLTAVEESLRFLLTGEVDYELRTTVEVSLHCRDTFRDIRLWLEELAPDVGVRRYCIQPFVDRDTVLWSGLRAPSVPEMEGFRAELEPLAGIVEIRGL